MSLSKKYDFTDEEEARTLVHFLTTPLEVVQRWRRERGRDWSELKDQVKGLRPDEYQGNHPREYEVRILETQIRLMKVALSAIEPIRADLDRIHSMRLEKPLHRLWEVYDVYAGQLRKCGQPLSDSLLTEGIPALVFTAAIDNAWIPYPLVRPKTGVAENFLEGSFDPSRYKRVPKRNLVERFADYSVTKGYGEWFKGHLEGRVAYWRVKAPKRQMQAASIQPGHTRPPAPGSKAEMRKKRPSHPDPESLLRGKSKVTYETAAEVLRVTIRRVRELVAEERLEKVGQGHSAGISVDTLRDRLGISKKSEQTGTKRN